MPLTVAVDLSAVDQRLTAFEENLSQRLSGEVNKVLGDFVNYERRELRGVLEQVRAIQKDNATQLEKIRKTLEERLDECCKRLERRQGFAHRRPISHRGFSRVR